MHVLLWWLSDSGRMGASAREIIANPDHDILVNIVSLWKIAIKIRIGKLDANMNDILAAILAEGFSLLQTQPEHLHILMSLSLHHRDPFKHLQIPHAEHTSIPFGR